MRKWTITAPYESCLQSRQRRDFRAGHGLKFNRLYTYLPESEGWSSLEKALLLSPFFEIISKSHRIS
jgi:hypothetical protein